ncbi:MAG TPA: hypothetical protein VN370_01670 [Desulfitobacteriaceae bacterium]|nr:hypothetical protein [Desulfitobacteriaceae bacterium]
MEKNKVLGNIIIEESEIYLLKTIETGYDTIELQNFKGEDVDGDQMAEYFSRLEGIEKVKTLHISYNSDLKDLRIIKGFPNLTNVFIYGYKIKTLDGLEYLTNGSYLYIDTGKNHSRSIANIAQAPIEELTLVYARKDDYEAISASKTIKYIELGYCPHPPFDKWTDLPLEHLKFSLGKFSELGDLALLKQLRTMDIISCRKLERFVGDNSGVTWMLIDSCKKLDLSTIKTFHSIESLIINTNPNEVPLSAFGGLEKLKHLKFIRCKVNVDIMNLREVMPNLEKLFIDNLGKEKKLELSRLNPGLSFQY